MAQYGTIFDKETIKRQLVDANRNYEGRKTWENLYSSIDLSKQKELGALQLDYAKAMSDAYSSAYQTNAAIASSNLGQGYKEAAVIDTEAALEEAYAAYKSKYLENVADVESNAASLTSKVDTALDTQADYITQFANAPYEYLQYLFNEYSNVEQEKNIFYTDDLWKRYTYEELDEEGNLTGERLLKSWNDLSTDLFDESKNLTIAGTDYYDQTINAMAYQNPALGLSFGDWLAKNNEDLFNWSQSTNPYNFDVDDRNIGYIKTLFGLRSTDNDYLFKERFGGINHDKLHSIYSPIESKLQNLNTSNNVQEYQNVVSELKQITDDLHITEDLENKIGISYNDLLYQLSDISSSSKDVNTILKQSRNLVLNYLSKINAYTHVLYNDANEKWRNK